MKVVQVRLCRIHGWLGVLACCAGAAQGQVLLNEIMADNLSALANEDTFPDWAEVGNAGPGAADLSGWGLTDSLATPFKFTFPAGTTLQEGQTLIVFLDNETALPGWHAGFSLDSKGESLALFSPANPFAPRDVLSFGLQLPDFSIGRVPHLVGSWVLTLSTPGETNAAASLAATTNLFINEWMASPSSGDDWLELYNQAPDPVQVGGLVLTDSVAPDPIVNRAIPLLSFVAGQGFHQFIADDLNSPEADHLDFRLSANGEILTLHGPDRVTILDRVIYGPQTADVSQGRLPDGDDAVVFFPDGRDTPGASNFLPLTNVVVNEVLSHSDPPYEDAIELANLLPTPVDISYWWISDSPGRPFKFRVPPGTVLPGFAFKVYYEADFNPGGQGVDPDFTLNSSQGDDVYLVTADVTGKLTGYRGRQTFSAAENTVAFGRHINSQGDVAFVAMSHLTFGMDNPQTLDQFRLGTGLSNALPKVGPLVINEIMYHPSGEDGDNTLDEYVEILNLTQAPVPLYDPGAATNTWRLRSGVSFNFPQFVTVPAGGAVLVVNFDPIVNVAQLNAFRARHQIPVSIPIFGPYSGKLDNRGETLELYKPDSPQGPGQSDEGFVPYILADRLSYEDRDPWPDNTDATGLALQRLAPEAYADDPINWMGAPPSPGMVLVRIDSVQQTAGALQIRFRQVAGRTYSVQRRLDLTIGSWVTAASYPAVPNTTNQLYVVNQIATQPPGFFRVVTPMMP